MIFIIQLHQLLHRKRAKRVEISHDVVQVVNVHNLDPVVPFDCV